MLFNSQPFAAPVSGSSRLSTVSKWWTLQKVFVVRHSRGFSLYTDAPAGMLFMVVQASDRLQSSSKAALRTSSGNQPTTRSQDAATSRQEPEVGSVMGESSAFTTAASFVDPAGEDTHTHTRQWNRKKKLLQQDASAGATSETFLPTLPSKPTN